MDVTIAGPLAGSRRRTNDTQSKFSTGLDGKCTVPIPTAAFWRVGVQRDGYLDAEDPSRVEHVETVRVEFNKAVRLTVGLLKASALEGTVYLDDGRRVSQARVNFQPAVITTGPDAAGSGVARATHRQGWSLPFPGGAARRLRHVDLAARGAGHGVVEPGRQRRVDGLRRHALAPQRHRGSEHCARHRGPRLRPAWHRPRPAPSEGPSPQGRALRGQLHPRAADPRHGRIARRRRGAGRSAGAAGGE